MMKKPKNIDFNFIKIEDTLKLLVHVPNNQKLITTLYTQFKPIFLPYLKEEELFNDFFLKVLDNVKNIDFNKNVKNYLITLSKNIEINEHIKNKRPKHNQVVFDEMLTLNKGEDLIEDELERLEKDLFDLELDSKYFAIVNTLKPDDQLFLSNYFKLDRNKTNKERSKMCKIKKEILKKWNQKK